MIAVAVSVKNIDGEQLTNEDIVKKYEKLVFSIAQKHKKKALRSGLDFEDVVSEGNVGLLKAYKGFKSEYGFKFMTYAYPMVDGEVRRRIRDSNEGPAFPKRIKGLAFKADFDSDTRKIASDLDINIQEANEVWAYKHKSGTVSLNMTVSNENEITMQDVLPTYEDFSSIFVKGFSEYLAVLYPKLALVLKLTLEEKTQMEIGKLMGVSQTEISRRLKRIKNLYLQYEGADNFETNNFN